MKNKQKKEEVRPATTVLDHIYQPVPSVIVSRKDGRVLDKFSSRRQARKHRQSVCDLNELKPYETEVKPA